jgi:hypothetical protein
MNAYVRNYLCSGLEAGPKIYAKLLTGITEAESDARPDPERFTIREVLAHLADWEPIWHARISRIVQEDRPSLEDIDEGELALQNNYAECDLNDALARFTEGRAALTALLRALPPEAWLREGVRHWGALSVDGFAGMILGHDGYHAAQVIEQRG